MVLPDPFTVTLGMVYWLIEKENENRDLLPLPTKYGCHIVLLYVMIRY